MPRKSKSPSSNAYKRGPPYNAFKNQKKKELPMLKKNKVGGRTWYRLKKKEVKMDPQKYVYQESPL